MEGKLAPPPKFYSGPLFRNTCDLICPLGKAILLRQMDEISPHVSGGAMLRPFRSSFARHQGRYFRSGSFSSGESDLAAVSESCTIEGLSTRTRTRKRTH